MFRRYVIPCVGIGNGIDLHNYVVQAAPDNPEPKLVFIGSPRQPWHGIDKIQGLAQHFVQWSFDIIGYDSRDVKGSIPPNMHLHGYLARSEYEGIMDQADIAIGSLALYRNDMQEGSSLKVREYLARGIPTIVGCRDVDFSEEEPYVLVLPDTQQDLAACFPQVQAFVHKWKGRRIAHSAIEHIDTAYKERKRLEFLESIRQKCGKVQ